MTPDRAAEMTMSGPETRNIGATTIGILKEARNSLKRARASLLIVVIVDLQIVTFIIRLTKLHVGINGTLLMAEQHWIRFHKTS